MATKAKIRATFQPRQNPDDTASAAEKLRTAATVEVLEELQDWIKVRSAPTGSTAGKPVEGWVPRKALSLSADQNKIFPDYTLESGESFPGVPHWLTATDLIAWLRAPGKPGWISAGKWAGLDPGAQRSLVEGIRRAIGQRQAAWDEWRTRMAAEGRLEDATMDEWMSLQNGGMDVWAVRADSIFTEPAEKGSIDSANTDHILRWTGEVRWNLEDPDNKIWYRISIFKNGKEIIGWYKGDLLDPYIHPSEENDPAIESNKDKQFNLTTPRLRLPLDDEIAETKKTRKSGFQYINIREALDSKKDMVHHNLCGEFCVAALVGMDVIPVLKKWVEFDPRSVNEKETPKYILANDEDTGVTHMETMLKACQGEFKPLGFLPPHRPLTPARLRNRLEQGWMAIMGVRIYKIGGHLSEMGKDPDKTTGHWVVLEDILPVGKGGWVRIYNPFNNREEVYSYDLFHNSHGGLPRGLWVKPKISFDKAFRKDHNKV